jgi:hypothetical protein
MMTNTTATNWQALDWLRGLSIIGMLFNLTPGHGTSITPGWSMPTCYRRRWFLKL